VLKTEIKLIDGEITRRRKNIKRLPVVKPDDFSSSDYDQPYELAVRRTAVLNTSRRLLTAGEQRVKTANKRRRRKRTYGLEAN